MVGQLCGIAQVYHVDNWVQRFYASQPAVVVNVVEFDYIVHSFVEVSELRKVTKKIT